VEYNRPLALTFKQLDQDRKGININKEYINHLWFADDIALVSDSLKNAQQRLKELKQTTESIDLTINFQRPN